MRVTFNSTYRTATSELALAAERLAYAQQQVSSGKKIQQPSDDPVAAQGAVLEHGELAAIDRYEEAADSIGSRLSVADTVLSDVVSQLTAARAAATGARGSTLTVQQRAAAAGQMDAIREALLSDVNTIYRGSYLFAGAAASTEPYSRQSDGSIGSYAGDANVESVDIDRHQSVRTSFNGDELMRGSDTDGLFVVLDRLSTAIRNGDSQGMADGSAALERAFNRAVGMQSRLGTDLNRLDSERTRLGALRLASADRLSKHEDADMAQAISGMNQADTAYRAALGATGTISKLSLMDYLR